MSLLLVVFFFLGQILSHDLGGKMLEKNYEYIDNILHIGGVSTLKLLEEYGTPLYVYDQKLIKDTAACFLKNFKSDSFKTEVIYASKALSNLYILGLLAKEGTFVDAVSMGEIFLALKAGFKPEKIHFHGNNKTKEELAYAIDNNIGLIIIDNYDEFKLIEELLLGSGKKIDCLLRINPDVKTSTHKYIQTSNADSKFGINIRDEKLNDIIKEMANSKAIKLLGFHAHIGSQVNELGFFKEEADILLRFTKQMEEDLAYKFKAINFGGGFGVRQNTSDPSYDLEAFLKEFIGYIEKSIKDYDLSIETLGIEPGRSMVNQAGTTLYRVGSIKHTLEGLPLVFVDGGMSDNIRPSLYGAKYDSLIANRAKGEAYQTYRVAGKLCESGDILIDEARLNDPQKGDILAIENTGAYSLAMSSSYNKQLKPAVVFVEDGKANLAVKRESLEDLIVNDLEYVEE